MPISLVTKRLVNTYGPLPIEKEVLISGDKAGALFVSGSVFSKSDQNHLGIKVTLDGQSISQLRIFANPRLDHMALVPEIIPVNLSDGHHTVRLAALPGTVTDANDVFTVTLMYAREAATRAGKTPRPVKTSRKRK